MNTLLLDQSSWDLVLDALGNIAMAASPYAVAQDVASEAKVFSGECYYDTTKGILYFQEIFGQYPPIEAMRTQYIDAAKLVPGVLDAVCYFSSFKDRVLTGQIQVTDQSGVTLNVAF